MGRGPCSSDAATAATAQPISHDAASGKTCNSEGVKMPGQPMGRTTVGKGEEEGAAERSCGGLTVTPFPLRCSGREVEESGMKE